MNEKKSWLGRALSARGVQSVVTAACGFILLFIIFCILSPQFRSGNNIQNLFRQIAPTMIIGIGQGFVLITGNIDLSIGSVVGMACMTAGTLMSNGMNPWLSCLLALLLSLAIGLANGVLVAKVEMPAFIATLGTMTLARGLAQLVNNNHNTNFIGETAQGFRDTLYYDSFLNDVTTEERMDKVSTMGYGLGYIGYPISGIAAMCLFCISIGTWLSFLARKSRSIWPPALFHGSVNASASIGLLFLPEGSASYLLGPALSGIIPSMLAGIAILIIIGRDNNHN